MAIFGDSDCLNVAQHVAEVVLSEVVTVFCIWALSRHAMRQGTWLTGATVISSLYVRRKKE